MLSKTSSDLSARAKEFVPSLQRSLSDVGAGRSPPSLRRSQSFGGFDLDQRSQQNTPSFDWGSFGVPIGYTGGSPATHPGKTDDATGWPTGPSTILKPIPFDSPPPMQPDQASGPTGAYDKHLQKKMWDEEMCAAALRESAEFDDQVSLSPSPPPSPLDGFTPSSNLNLSPSKRHKEKVFRFEEDSTCEERTCLRRASSAPMANLRPSITGWKHRRGQSLCLDTIKELGDSIQPFRFPPSQPFETPPQPSQAPFAPLSSPALQAATAPPALEPSMPLIPPVQPIAPVVQTAPLNLNLVAMQLQAASIASMQHQLQTAVTQQLLLQRLQHNARTKSFEEWRAELGSLGMLASPVPPSQTVPGLPPSTAQAC